MKGKMSKGYVKSNNNTKGFVTTPMNASGKGMKKGGK